MNRQHVRRGIFGRGPGSLGSKTSSDDSDGRGSDIGGERVALMMKHKGMTREQAEVEAAKW